MSVINKMLKDLDNRGGLGPRNLEEGIRDVERVRAQPRIREEKRPWGVISAAVVLVVAAIGAGWYLLRPSAPAPAVARQAPAAAPKAAAVAEAPKPTPPVVAEAPKPTPPVVAEPPKPMPPVVAEAPKPAPPPVAEAAKPAPKPASEPPKAAPAEPKAPPVAVATAPAQPAPSGPLSYIADAQMAKGAADKSAATSEAAVAAARSAIPGRATPTPPPAVAVVQPAPAKVEVAPPKAEPVPAKVEAAPAKVEPAPAPRDTVPAAPGKVSVDRDRPLTGPARAVAEYRSASELLSQGRLEAALNGFATALRHDPRNVPARQALAVLLLENGRSADAQGVLREGIEAVPSNTSWPMLLARLQVEGGDVKGGLETLERSLPQARGQPEYHAFVATLMQMQGRHGEAIQQYDQALRANPDSARSLAGLAISLEAEKRIPEAREAYRRALAAGGLGRDLEAFAERKLKQLQ